MNPAARAPSTKGLDGRPLRFAAGEASSVGVAGRFRLARNVEKIPGRIRVGNPRQRWVR